MCSVYRSAVARSDVVLECWRKPADSRGMREVSGVGKLVKDLYDATVDSSLLSHSWFAGASIVRWRGASSPTSAQMKVSRVSVNGNNEKSMIHLRVRTMLVMSGRLHHLCDSKGSGRHLMISLGRSVMLSPSEVLCVTPTWLGPVEVLPFFFIVFVVREGCAICVVRGGYTTARVALLASSLVSSGIGVGFPPPCPYWSWRML